MGKVGLPISEVDRMSLREAFNAIEGYADARRQEFSALFEIVRFGSYYNVFSNDQAKALKKAKNPYIERPKKPSNKNIGRMLSALAQAFKGNNG